MTVPNREVIAAFVDGVAAIEDITSRFSDRDWSAPTPCEGWTATDLAGHVRTAAARYHAFLDAALAGQTRQLVPLREMDRINAEEMAALPKASGPEHIREFVALGLSYRERVVDAWDVPIGIMDGTIAAGLALGVEALEFHVHAWDFATVVAEEYRPSNPEVIFDVAARAFVLSKARVGQRLIGPLQTAMHPAVRRVSGDPWQAILKRMGRRR